MAISMLKIRRPLGRLIFNMGIAIPGKTVFLIETAPWSLVIKLQHDERSTIAMRNHLNVHDVSNNAVLLLLKPMNLFCFSIWLYINDNCSRMNL